MKTKMLLVLLLAVLVIFACQKENSTEPTNGNIHPQQDIPWPSLADSPWPMFHHDPQSTGRSPLAGPRQGVVKWTFKPGGAVASPIVIGSDSTIYFISVYEGEMQASYLYAITAGGNLKWKLNLETGPESSIMALQNGMIFVAGRKLYLINPDGDIEKASSPGEVIAPFVNVGKDGIFYLIIDSKLTAIGSDLEILWQKSVDYRFSDSHLPISPDGDYIYSFIYLDNNLHFALSKINLSNKEISWQFELNDVVPNLIYTVPCLDSDGNAYFGTWGSIDGKSAFYGITKDGEKMWAISGDATLEATIDKNGKIYFQQGKSGLYLKSVFVDGDVQWKVNCENNQAPLCSDRDNVIYTCSTEHVSAYSENGQLLWQVPLQGNVTRVTPFAITYGNLLIVGTFANPFSESLVYAIE